VWGFYTVALRKSAPDLPLKPLMGASFIFGAVYYYVIALVVEGPPNILHQAPQTWGWILLHVLFPSLLAFVCFNAALQRAPASLVNILVGAELAFTVLFSWLLFGIALAPDQLGGLAVVLVSVTAYLWMHSRSTAAPTPSPKSAP
jgi:drug/metabolite transporter (DMT)-like permease